VAPSLNPESRVLSPAFVSCLFVHHLGGRSLQASKTEVCPNPLSANCHQFWEAAATSRSLNSEGLRMTGGPALSLSGSLAALSLWPAPDGLNRTCQAAGARLRFFGPRQRFDIFALIRIAQLLPSLPCRRHGLERLDEVGRRPYFSLAGVEFEPHYEGLISFQPRRHAIAPSQRNPGLSTHRADGAPVRIPVERHLDGHTCFAKYAFGIECKRDGTH